MIGGMGEWENGVYVKRRAGNASWWRFANVKFSGDLDAENCGMYREVCNVIGCDRVAAHVLMAFSTVKSRHKR